jgi:hypothetical protein
LLKLPRHSFYAVQLSGKPAVIALKQLVLYDAIFLELGQGVLLG